MRKGISRGLDHIGIFLYVAGLILFFCSVLTRAGSTVNGDLLLQHYVVPLVLGTLLFILAFVDNFSGLAKRALI